MSVILSTGVTALVHAGIHTPWADTNPPGRHQSPRQTSPSRHPQQTPPWQTTLRTDTPWADTSPWQTPLGQTPPADTSLLVATAADGTHPTYLKRKKNFICPKKILKMSLCHSDFLANMCNYVPINSLQISQFFLKSRKIIKIFS